MELCKCVEASYGGVKLEVEVFNNPTMMTVKSTVNMRPKNRRQKKLWKQEAAKFKKVGKGLYAVTQICLFNPHALAKVVGLLDRDENGNIGFNIEKGK